MLLVLPDIPKRSWTLNAGHRCLGMGQQTSAEADQFITAVCASLGKVLSQTAVALRAEAGRKPGIACSQYADGPVLRAQVQQQGRKFDDIVIDAGGRDSTALRAALVLSDVLLVPFQLRSVDVWALADISALVEEATRPRDIRDGGPPFAPLSGPKAHQVGPSRG